MKLATFACTVSFIIISGNCGLVKDLFGKVHEDVHTVVGKTVNAIGTVAHKVHEPFGVFLHRSKTNLNPDTETEKPLLTPIPKTDAPLDQTSGNNGGHNNENNMNHEQSTASIVEQTSAKIIENFNTESSKDNGEDTTKPENVSYGNKDTQTTTEYISGNNEIKLENILPLALYNDTYFKETDLYAINAVRGSFPNTDNSITDLSKTEENNNGTTFVEPNGGPSNKSERAQNFISDQVVFPDNRNTVKREIRENIECPKGLVKSTNGYCLESIEINLEKQNKRKVSSVFNADCPKGQRRALDGSCQTDLGWST